MMRCVLRYRLARFAALLSDGSSRCGGGRYDEHHRAFASVSPLDKGALRPPRVSDDEFIFNPLTSSVVRTTAPQIRMLQAVGVAPVDGMLTVVDSMEFRRFHRLVKANDRAVMDKWPRRMRTALESIASVTTTDEFPSRFAQYLADLTNARNRSRIAATVIGELRPEDIATPSQLNRGQRCVLDIALRGHHLYVGGTAGTGKTDALRAIRKALMQKGLHIGTTATTGLAAANLGGVTYHSLLGVSRQGEIRKLSTLARLDVLIVDEVSMMDRQTFEALERALRRERNDNRPFGGLQMILSGDFMQLEAIPNRALQRDGRAEKLQLVFESRLFEPFVKMMLTEQVRQASQPLFASGLLELRRGLWPASFESMIKTVPVSTPPADDELLLFCRKDDVNRVNTEKMQRLDGASALFEPFPQVPTLTGKWTDSIVLIVTEQFNPDDFINVVFVAIAQKHPRVSYRDLVGYRYLSDGYVIRMRLPDNIDNGELLARRARFVEIMQNVDTVSGNTARQASHTAASDTLIPFDVESTLSQAVESHPIAQTQILKVGARVMLRYNLTPQHVNGSTGTVIDFVTAATENLSPALSRNTWIAECVEAYAAASRLRVGNELPMLPVVEFASGDRLVIPPVPLAVGGDALTLYYEVQVLHVPLVPGYASTAHKAQGLTLNCNVRVCLERMWHCNHIVYVALSRVRTSGQLTVSGLDKSKIRVNPKALAFDELIPHAMDSPLDAETSQGANWFDGTVDRVESSHGSRASASVSRPRDKTATTSGSSVLLSAGIKKHLKRSQYSERACQARRIDGAVRLAAGKTSFASIPLMLHDKNATADPN